MNFQSGQTYNGNGQTISDAYFQLVNATDITIENYNFVKTGFKLTDCKKIKFRKCKYTSSHPDAALGRVIDIYGDLDDSSVTYCEFRDVQCDSVIFCDNGQISRSQFNWNLMVNVTHGMHFSWGGAQKRNDVEIAFNEFHAIRRFALELQNGVDGLEIHHNWMDDFLSNNSRMAISCATGPMADKTTYSRRVRIHDNWIGDPMRSWDQDKYAAIEIMGEDFEVYNNATKGPWGCIGLWGWNKAAAQFHDNVWENSGQAYKGEAENRPLARATVTVRRLDKPTPQQVFNNECDWQSGIRPAVATSGLTVTATAPGSLTINGLPGTAGKVYRKTKGGEDWYLLPNLIVAGQKSYIDSGPDPVGNLTPTLKRQWEYFYKIELDNGQVFTAQGQVADQDIPMTSAVVVPAPITDENKHTVIIDGVAYEPKD